jgi:carboxypeptidase PM20D1
VQLPAGEQLKLAERLGQAIRLPTVSTDRGPPDPVTLRALFELIKTSYPLLNATLQREVVNDFALLYRWRGQEEAEDAQKARKPYLLLAHQDVVPVEPGTESAWHRPPFSGEIADGFVWGRGTIDDKSALMAILEAVEALLRSGFRPQRTLYLAFGHDEEISGTHGAAVMADLLQKRGVRFDFVLDEGQAVTQGLMPGIKQKVALIGLVEKGYVSVELTADDAGGHSSMPPPHTTVGILSRAITRLEQHPMPASLCDPMAKLFSTIGPHAELPERLLFTNMWLFKPLLLYALAQRPVTNASIRTTTAATVFEGSPKDNVLPQHARAVVNFRLLPGDTPEAVLRHVNEVVDDPRVVARPLPGLAHAATPESSTEAPAFGLIEHTIEQLFPETLVTPSLNAGATDARHYVEVTDNIYRFVPLLLGPQDVTRIHGTDERVSVSDYVRAVAFYQQLIRNADQNR